MTNYRSGATSAILLALTTLLSAGTAKAGLIGVGGTVQVVYYNGVLASPEGQLNSVTNSSSPVALTAPQSFLQGAASGSTTAVNDLQLVITNQLGSSFPFCVSGNAGTSCTDAIDGFGFLFTGENILGVSVDPGSASTFLPVSGTFGGNTHSGLQLINNNQIRVDVTGDGPSAGQQLILDLSFTPAPPTPEPGTFGLLAVGLAVVAFRRIRRQGSAEPVR